MVQLDRARSRVGVLEEQLHLRADAVARQWGGVARSSHAEPERLTKRWAICTGAGASADTLREAVEHDIDTLIVGEGPHWTAVDADELGLVPKPLAEAREAGADAMVTPCPLCHLSLDAWQGKAAREADMDFGMPIFHLAQLVGAAAGLTYDELLFKRHITKTHPATDKIYAQQG